ncbi:MAG: hypothetical protein GC191_14580 [Azospirillum sp.]|nr:hypothetical protein [Azospirillum sp.]
MGKWILGGVTGLIGMLGLFLSSRAADETFYYGGLIAFVVAIIFIFGMVKSAFDRAEARAHGDNAEHA